MKRCDLLLVLALALSGCTTVQPITPPDSKAAAPPALVRPRIEGEPVVAVALSGGGSKAGPFALGVLEALIRANDLEEIDIVSSVSGGGYAALYMYSRAADIASGSAQAPASLADGFADCLPRRYTMVDPSAEVVTAPILGLPICPRYYNNYYEPGDPYRFQNHLRGYQNLLREDFVYTSTSQNHGGVNLSMAKHVGASLLTAVPHHLVNTLFDWKLRLSPTGKTYDQNILRTWGHTSAPLSQAMCGERECPRVPVREPPGGLTFDQLGTLIVRSRSPECATSVRGKVCNLPAWYINTTATNHPVKQHFVAYPYTFQDVFHFSAEGYGSDSLGTEFWSQRNPLAPRASVPQAVAAAAAFFDITPPNDFPPWLRLTTAGVEHVLNLSWGHIYPNYTLPEREYYRRRTVHRLLPFPLYLFHHNDYGRDGIHIRLSDGGRAENLGVYTALRLGSTDIIVVDAAGDAKAELGDICNLRRQIRFLGERALTLSERHVGDVELDGLMFGGQVFPLSVWCDPDSRVERLADLNLKEMDLVRQWPAAVLVGCVLSVDAGGRTCADNADRTVARLYVIKPAITAEAMRQFELAGPSTAAACLPNAATDEKRLTNNCDAVLRVFYQRLSPHLPPEVAAYLLVNAGTRIFPQHSTVRVTASSSPFIFGAYRALARHLTGQLVLDRSNKDRPIIVTTAALPAALSADQGGASDPP